MERCKIKGKYYTIGNQDGSYRQGFGGKRVTIYPLIRGNKRVGTLHVGFNHHFARPMWWDDSGECHASGDEIEIS